MLTDPVAILPEAKAVSEEALTLFRETGDDLGLAHAYYLVSWIAWLQSRALPSAAANDRVLEHGRRAGARALVGQVTMQQTGPLFFGPFTIEEIRARIQRIAEDDSVLAQTAVLSLQADLAQREGRFDDALELLGEAEALHGQLGSGLGTTITLQMRADVLSDAGRFEEAVTTYRDGLQRLEALGMTSFASTTTIALAETLYRRGDAGEAEGLAIKGEELGARRTWSISRPAAVFVRTSQQTEANSLTQSSLHAPPSATHTRQTSRLSTRRHTRHSAMLSPLPAEQRTRAPSTNRRPSSGRATASAFAPSARRSYSKSCERQAFA